MSTTLLPDYCEPGRQTPTETAKMDPETFARIQKHVEEKIEEKHNSLAWLHSDNRYPEVMQMAYPKLAIRTRTEARWDNEERRRYTVDVPLEWMYTANEMKAEISQKLDRAKNVDPRCHPDYDLSTKFSVQELLDYVVPNLPESQPRS